MFEVTCDECGKTFSSDTDLEQHNLFHIMETMARRNKEQSSVLGEFYWLEKIQFLYRIMEKESCDFDSAFKKETEMWARAVKLQEELNANRDKYASQR